MKRWISIIAITIIAFAACNKREVVDTNIMNESSQAVYSVRIPVSFDAQTKALEFSENAVVSKFRNTDLIYLYNESKEAFACEPTGNMHPYNGYEMYDPIPLTVSNLSVDGITCTLTGDNLTFYKYDEINDVWSSAISVDPTDTYTVFYQMNVLDPAEPYNCLFDYAGQDGTADCASLHDFAKAVGITMELDGTTLSITNNEPLVNQSTLFRQSFSFIDGGNPVTPTPTIEKLKISTDDTEYPYPIVSVQLPLNGYSPFNASASETLYNPTGSILDANNASFFALPFNNAEEYSQVNFTAIDSEGYSYSGSKTKPAGGFLTGKYYYSLTPTELVRTGRPYIKPSVSRDDGGSAAELIPDADNFYNFNTAPISITINGDSKDYIFDLWTGGTVTLSGNGTAECTQGNFIFCNEGVLIINLASDYSIDCRNFYVAIQAMGTLKLKTTGGPHTLTLIAKEIEDKGLVGYENYPNTTLNLPVDGYVVELAGPVEGPDNNGDSTPDYYTFVYTVSVAP